MHEGSPFFVDETDNVALCALCELDGYYNLFVYGGHERERAEDQAAIREAAEIIAKTGGMKTRSVWWHETHAAAIARAG
jgi:hypothetical protein